MNSGENQINALINLGQNKTVEKVYDDALSPAGKKLGIALSTIVDLANTILWPIKFINEKTRLYFENNLKAYIEKLSKIPEEKVVPVPTEISYPLLEKFCYVSNKTLSDAFVSLLLNASYADSASLVHPAFISMIARLCPDEAKIINYLKNKDAVPYIFLRSYKKEDNSEFKTSDVSYTGIEVDIDFMFPTQFHLYLDNLVSLGVINNRQDRYLNDESAYRSLEIEYKSRKEHFAKIFEENEPEYELPTWERGYYDISRFGKLFIKACNADNLP